MTRTKNDVVSEEEAVATVATDETKTTNNEERVQPLTPEAWAYYANTDATGRPQDLDSLGTRFSWFLPLPHLRQLANRLAGGPGELLTPLDLLWLNLVEQDRGIVEVFGEEFLEFVEMKFKRAQAGETGWDAEIGTRIDRMTATEQAALLLVIQPEGESVEETLKNLGADPEVIASRQLLRPITRKEIEFLVRRDGEMETCFATEQEFQPISSCRILVKDLGKLRVESVHDAVATVPYEDKHPQRHGNYLIAVDENDTELMMEYPFSGGMMLSSSNRRRDMPHDFDGHLWLYEGLITQNTKGALGKARYDFGEARNSEKPKSQRNVILLPCYDREEAKGRVAYLNRDLLNERKALERRNAIRPKKRRNWKRYGKGGGLGPATPWK